MAEHWLNAIAERDKRIAELEAEVEAFNRGTLAVGLRDRIAELEEELRVANLMTGAFERMKLATDELKAAQQRIAELEAALRKAESFIDREGYRRCDNPSWVTRLLGDLKERDKRIAALEAKLVMLLKSRSSSTSGADG